MGQSRWIDDDQIQRKRTPSFPSHESHCPEERSKAKEVENYQCTSVPGGCGLKIWPIVQASKIVDNNTYTFDWSPCTRRFIAKVKRTSEKALTTKSRDKDLYWCRILENSWSRTVLHDKRHWRVLTIYRTIWYVLSTLYHETKNQLSRKVGFEGTPKLGPYWKSQPVTCKVNLEWKLELNL